MEHMEQSHHRRQFSQPSRQLPLLVNQVPPLVMSSSNISTSTLDSELVSPDPSQEAHFGIPIQSQTLKPVLRNSTSPSATATSEDSVAPSIGQVPVLNVGSKRTATGQVKQASPTRGHSRDASKRNSAIELSADLRTRLKYAMLKVQNGWESQNIQQLEQLQVASPKTIMTDSPSRWSRRDSTSSTSDSAYYASPFTTTTTPAATVSNIRRPHDTSRMLQRQLQFPPQPPPPTHSQYTLPPMRTAPHHPLSSLAPPAQIATSSSASSSSHRRSKTGSASARFGHQLSKSNSSGRARSGTNTSTTTTTPRGIHTKAEKDAVDSLLFMSSPGNAVGGRVGVRKRSNTFTASSTVESPLRHKRLDFVN